MTARIAGFQSRAELGMARPTSVSRNITPARGGATTHYGGPAQPRGSHDVCIRTWLAWQRYHMGRNHPQPTNGHNWVDIGYTAGYCDHGYVLAGRGYGVRTAAQGTNDGNQRFHAFVWIGGGNQVPTREALDALEWLIADSRENGGAGMEVRDHSDFKSTACAGARIRAHGRKFHNRAINAAGPVPRPTEPQEEDIMATIGQLDDLIKRRTAILWERANEAVRLGEAAAAGTIADIRYRLGMPDDPASDAVHVGRIRGEGPYDLAEVRRRLEVAAERAKAVPMADRLAACRVAEGTADDIAG